MKYSRIRLAILSLFFTTGITVGKPSYWQKISLSDLYVAPGTNKLSINGVPQSFKNIKLRNDGAPDKVESKLFNAKSFTLTFPTHKANWFLNDPSCDRLKGHEFAQTQTRLRSDYISSISGLSFLGSIRNKKIGPFNENHFAIFFHIHKCYDGGPEYGFAFYENMKTALFYVCGDCNLNNQTWWDWPGKDGKEIGNERVNDPENKVATALSDPSQKRYYNIQVIENGNFIVQVINPQTWETLECTINKPANFPNLYGKGG